jgi:hypothetical protein
MSPDAAAPSLPRSLRQGGDFDFLSALASGVSINSGTRECFCYHPSVSTALDGIRNKIERAEKHIADVGLACQGFFAANQYRIGHKDNPTTAERTLYMVSVPEVGPEISVVIGDAIQNLRSALDHLAHALVVIGTSSLGPHPHVYFPIFDSASEYKAGKMRKIQGMRQDAIDAIDATEPYKGGSLDPDDTLWCLNALNKIDKHRLLLTVASQYESHSMTPGQRAQVVRGYYGSYPATANPPNLTGVHIPAKLRHFPLKAGDELLTAPIAEMYENVQFRFVVAFNEPGIIQREAVSEALQRMANLVRALTTDFVPLLS